MSDEEKPQAVVNQEKSEEADAPPADKGDAADGKDTREAVKEGEDDRRGRDRKDRSRSRDRKDRKDRDGDRRRRSRSRERRRSSSRSRRDRERPRSRDRERRRSRDRRRSRSPRDRRRRGSSSDEYGYVPRKKGSSAREPMLFQVEDPFSKLRAAASKATDPVEIARQMQEQQLRARQLVLQQQAASAVAAASKTQREVYVGNLAQGMVTNDMLRQLFNTALMAAFPDKCAPGLEPVVNCSVHTEGRYAFVELRTSEMSTASLQLNGQVQLMGTTLSIGRPSGYVDPTKAQAAAQAAAEALSRFQAESQALRRSAGTLTEAAAAKEETSYLRLRGVVGADALADEEQYAEVVADINEECGKFGTVLRVGAPRPADPATAAEAVAAPGSTYGDAFVQFLDVEAAKQALAAINGRLFAGVAVCVDFMQPQPFMDALTISNL